MIIGHSGYFRIFYKLPQLLILNSIAIYYRLFWTVCALWLAKAFTATHTPGDTANHRRLHTLSHLSVYLSKAEYVSQSNLIYTTCKTCPIVGELASSQMEANFAISDESFIFFSLLSVIRTSNEELYLVYKKVARLFWSQFGHFDAVKGAGLCAWNNTS